MEKIKKNLVKLTEKDTILNDENKLDYLKLRIRHELFDIYKDLYENILIGFYSLIPRNVIQQFSYIELELLVCGDEFNFQDWKENVIYINCKANDPIITWFWEIIDELNSEGRKDQIIQIFEYTTGSCRTPGTETQGLQSSKFSINLERDTIGSRVGELPNPISSTSTNTLTLYDYKEKNTLKESLFTAISHPRSFSRILDDNYI